MCYPNLHGIKITLMDIDEKRLRFIGAMGKKLADELHARIDFELTTDREKALDGASFVINTAQDQGHPWATELTEMAKRHGYMYGGLLSLTCQRCLSDRCGKGYRKNMSGCIAYPIIESGF